MHFLSGARHINKLRIDSGVYGEGDPVKAAKAFHADAYKFLEAVSAAKNSKDAGVDVLEFGINALQHKDDKKTSKPWPKQLHDEFCEELRSKLR